MPMRILQRGRSAYVIAGYLQKKSKWSLQWVDRYFVLTPTALFYFKKDRSALYGQERGHFLVDELIVRPLPDKLCFDIFAAEKHRILKAANEEEFMAWSNALNEVQRKAARDRIRAENTSNTNTRREALKRGSTMAHDVDKAGKEARGSLSTEKDTSRDKSGRLSTTALLRTYASPSMSVPLTTASTTSPLQHHSLTKSSVVKLNLTGESETTMAAVSQRPSSTVPKLDIDKLNGDMADKVKVKVSTDAGRNASSSSPSLKPSSSQPSATNSSKSVDREHVRVVSKEPRSSLTGPSKSSAAASAVAAVSENPIMFVTVENPIIPNSSLPTSLPTAGTALSSSLPSPPSSSAALEIIAGRNVAWQHQLLIPGFHRSATLVATLSDSSLVRIPGSDLYDQYVNQGEKSFSLNDSRLQNHTVRIRWNRVNTPMGPAKKREYVLRAISPILFCVAFIPLLLTLYYSMSRSAFAVGAFTPLICAFVFCVDCLRKLYLSYEEMKVIQLWFVTFISISCGPLKKDKESHISDSNKKASLSSPSEPLPEAEAAPPHREARRSNSEDLKHAIPVLSDSSSKSLPMSAGKSSEKRHILLSSASMNALPNSSDDDEDGNRAASEVRRRSVSSSSSSSSSAAASTEATPRSRRRSKKSNGLLALVVDDTEKTSSKAEPGDSPPSSPSSFSSSIHSDETDDRSTMSMVSSTSSLSGNLEDKVDGKDGVFLGRSSSVGDVDGGDDDDNDDVYKKKREKRERAVRGVMSAPTSPSDHVSGSPPQPLSGHHLHPNFSFSKTSPSAADEALTPLRDGGTFFGNVGTLSSLPYPPYYDTPAFLALFDKNELPPTRVAPWGLWTEDDVSKLSIRGPTFKTDKIKIPCGTPVFKLCHVDQFYSDPGEEKFYHIGSREDSYAQLRWKHYNEMKFNGENEFDAEFDPKLSPLFIVNFLYPGPRNRNFNLVLYFTRRIRPTHILIKQGKDLEVQRDDAAKEGDNDRVRDVDSKLVELNNLYNIPRLTAFDRLLTLFLREGEEKDKVEGGGSGLLGGDAQTEFNEFRDCRFKIIPRIAAGPWFVRKGVGCTPAILGKKISQTYYRDRSKGYFEIDADVGSSIVAGKILQLVKSTATSLIIELSFVLQGDSTDELPESLLGGVRLHNVNLDKILKYEENVKKNNVRII